jgi:hypothetical protein
MAELADAQVSGICDRKVVQVQVLFPAPKVQPAGCTFLLATLYSGLSA